VDLRLYGSFLTLTMIDWTKSRTSSDAVISGKLRKSFRASNWMCQLAVTTNCGHTIEQVSSAVDIESLHIKARTVFTER
jgi:hypothetical protein